jgi:regulator of RNase E activity RraA
MPVFAALAFISAAAVHVHLAQAQSGAAAATPLSDSELVAQFRHVEVASVSDALEQLTHKRMYMSHRMQPIFTSKFAGYARTVQLKKDEGNSDPEALTGMLEAIDQGSTDSVYVMVVEDGEDIAGMGGLMGTAMAARGYAGAVIDGGVRDVAYLRKIAFPVFATGIVPSTSVHHYRCAMECRSTLAILSSRIAMASPWSQKVRHRRCSPWRNRWTTKSIPCMPLSSNSSR